MLASRGSRFRARWDRAHGTYCQHQKSWLVDAGQPTETAFVGGINLNLHSVVSTGHLGEGENHDLYVEVTGPSATDVHHNFVQRWNEASERAADDGTWGHDGDDDLAFPIGASGTKGKSLVQIQRTVHAGRYSDSPPTPEGQSYDIAGCERSILEQYLKAIDAARRSIYIENQYLGIEAILIALDDALKCGVEIVVLVPAEPENKIRADRLKPERKAFYALLASLSRHDRFALVGIAGPGANGGRHDVYVHAKAMLIDDAWATIGSCNLHEYSLYGHGEMNASFWDPIAVRELRRAIFAEHLDRDTADLDDVAALSLYRQIARGNRIKRDAGDPDWQGLAFSLNPATYGT